MRLSECWRARCGPWATITRFVDGAAFTPSLCSPVCIKQLALAPPRADSRLTWTIKRSGLGTETRPKRGARRPRTPGRATQLSQQKLLPTTPRALREHGFVLTSEIPHAPSPAPRGGEPPAARQVPCRAPLPLVAASLVLAPPLRRNAHAFPGEIRNGAGATPRNDRSALRVWRGSEIFPSPM